MPHTDGVSLKHHPVDKSLVYLIIAGWGYEVAALSTGRVPTLTALVRKYPWAEAVVVGLLITHIHWKLPEVAADAARKEQRARRGAGGPVLDIQVSQPPPGAVRVAPCPAEGGWRRYYRR